MHDPRKELQEVRRKKKIAIIKVQGYLTMLSALLEVDYPGIKDEVAEIWRELKELMGSIYSRNSLLGILQAEEELMEDIVWMEEQEVENSG